VIGAPGSAVLTEGEFANDDPVERVIVLAALQAEQTRVRTAEFVELDQADSISPVPLAKIFPFLSDPNHFISRTIPPHHEGRFAIVTDVRRGAVDAGVPTTNGTEADGKDVWS
jgi:hypothetical protein